MSEEDFWAFMDRSRSIFGLDLESTSIDVQERSISKETTFDKNDFQLVIGFTATHIDRAKRLAEDIVRLEAGSRPTKVVICDNTGNPWSLREATSLVNDAGIEIVLKGPEEILKDSENGLLGNYYMHDKNRHGIAFGRTALHHYLYLESYRLPNPVVWVLDDDMRIQDSWLYNDLFNAERFRSLIFELMEQKVAVAVGGTYGDPPLPISSSVRVQLLEIHSAIQAMLTDHASDPWNGKVPIGKNCWENILMAITISPWRTLGTWKHPCIIFLVTPSMLSKPD